MCPRDPLLQKYGVYVDFFPKPAEPESVCFLTHAHSDHSSGVFSCRVARVFMSRRTRALLALQQRESKSAFEAPRSGEWFPVLPGVSARFLPTRHCPGSVMVVFRFPNEEYVLYTGDSAFHRRAPRWLRELPLRAVYYDDTFEQAELHVPSFSESGRELERELAGCAGPTRINVSVLGVEPVLLRVARSLGIRYAIAPCLRAHPRGAQLRYLLKSVLDPTSRFVLSHRQLDKSAGGEWILPTNTRFLCRRTWDLGPDVKLWHFGTHGDRRALNAFLADLSGDLVACGYAIKSVPNCS
jgi:hypothetical protein